MSTPAKRGSTATSNFGVGRREAHDSSAFYSRFPLPEISEDADIARPSCVDRLWVGDARDMDRYGDIADSSVALVVTSPPYYAGKEYEEAVGEGHIPASYVDYLEMLHDVFAECVRKLEPGGRIAVNVANLGRKPYRSLSADVIDILQNRLKLLLRGEVIWQKARGSTGSCAWGSFQLPGNPTLRDLTERVIIASKGRFDRAQRADKRAETGRPSIGSAFADEYMEATTDIWEIRPASATQVGHPAPFPAELPQRLIDLYTYHGDLVLDPFIGAGATALAAVRTDRRYVGFDTDPEYIALAERRLESERASLDTTGGTDSRRVKITPKSVRRRSGGQGDGESRAAEGSTPHAAAGDGSPAGSRSGAAETNGHGCSHPAPYDGSVDQPSPAAGGPSDASTFDDFQARAVREGIKARELAERLLGQCGFSDIRERVRCAAGVEVNFTARDQSGRLWRFDVSGAFSVTQRPGLRRTDTLWKALGKAATLHFAAQTRNLKNPDDSWPPPPLVLLTTNRPARNSNGHRALAAMTGPDRPIFAVVEMHNDQDSTVLAELARGCRASDSDPTSPLPDRGRMNGTTDIVPPVYRRTTDSASNPSRSRIR
ncbi:MAG: site-specific DNA-methyltransferase [bacterium]|nr:site-specific DNA-methyltransferase [bacterium]